MRSGRTKLRGWCEPCDAIAQIVEVLRTNLETQDLFDDGREVRQRADDPERRSIGGPCHASRGGESQRVLDRFERHAALVQLSGEQTVGTTDSTASAGSRSIGFQKSVYILALVHAMNLSLADHAAMDRRSSPYGSSAARGSAARPPSVCCRESCATRHRPDWS